MAKTPAQRQSDYHTRRIKSGEIVRVEIRLSAEVASMLDSLVTGSSDRTKVITGLIKDAYQIVNAGSEPGPETKQAKRHQLKKSANGWRVFLDGNEVGTVYSEMIDSYPKPKKAWFAKLPGVTFSTPSRHVTRLKAVQHLLLEAGLDFTELPKR